jgi:hypothetical protein
MIFGIAALLLGGYMFVLCVRFFFRRLAPRLRAIRHGAQADGVITAVTSQTVGTGESGRRLARPVVTFTDARGIKTKYTETITRPGSGRAGEHVTVRYDPADPEHTATIAAWADLRYQLVGSAVVLLALLGMCATGVLVIAGVW